MYLIGGAPMAKSVIALLFLVGIPLSSVSFIPRECGPGHSSTLSKQTVVSSAVMPTPTRSPAIAKKPCAEADIEFTRHNFVSAEEQYRDLLKKNPTERCASEGLNAIIAAKCQAARQLEQIGYREDSKKIYQDILSRNRGADRDISCVTQGLGRIQHAEIFALINKGDYEKAWEKTNDATVYKGDFLSIRTPEAGGSWHWWYKLRRIEAAIAPYLRPLLMAISAVLIVYVIWKVYPRRRLDIGEFTIGSAKLNQDQAKNPDLFRHAITARFEQAMSDLRKTPSLKSPDLIDGPKDTLPQLPNLTSLPKDVGDIWKFITKILPSRVVTLSGSFEYDKEKGAGLCVRLIHNDSNRLMCCYTVWQKGTSPVLPRRDKGSPVCEMEDYLCVIEEAAIRAFWSLYTATHWKKWRQWWKEAKLRSAFGTAKEESYCAYKRGMRYEGKDDTFCKNELKIALSHDPGNTSAMFDLGSVELKEARQHIIDGKDPKEEYEPIKRRFNDIKELSEGKNWIKSLCGTYQRDVAHIFSTYQLGIIDQDIYCLTESAPHKYSGLENLQEAIDHAQEARKKNPEVVTEQLIEAMEVPLRFAYVLDTLEEPEKMLADLEQVERKHHMDERVLYNLACYYSMVCQPMRYKKDVMKQKLDRSIKLLDEAVAIEKKNAAYAKIDPSFVKLKRERGRDFNKLLRRHLEPCWKEWLRVHLLPKLRAG